MTALELIAKEKKEKTGKLDIGKCGITEIPEELYELTWLEELQLCNKYVDWQKLMWIENKNEGAQNKIKIINPEIKKLQNLKKLRMGAGYGDDWQISKISLLSGLRKLQYLDLSGNKITDYSFLKDLKNLQSLYLLGNQISNISFLKDLKNLQTLCLRTNQISDINFLKDLKNLQTLDLYHNQISDISFLKDLKNLQTLYLNSNQISDITPLKNLIIDKGLEIRLDDYGSGIFINDNPLTTPPLEIVKRGRGPVVRYFKEIEETGQDFLYEAKLLIVGEPGAGKTSLYRKLDNEKATLPKKDETTRGIDIHEYYFKTAQKKDFRINLWDFGGQVIMYFAHQFFLTENSLYILVTDGRQENSNFKYWLHVIDLLGKESKIIVVQNEVGNRVHRTNLNDYLSRFKNIVFTKSLNLDKDIPKIRSLRKNMEEEIQKIPSIGKPLPKRWIQVRGKIKAEAEKNDIIDCNKYFELCKTEGIEDKDKALKLSEDLHSLGVFLHFQKDPILRNTLILNNNWATGAVYSLVDNEFVKTTRNGQFTENDFSKIWNEDRFEDKYYEIIQLLKNFNIIYEIPDTRKKKYIIPQLLPEKKPEYTWDDSKNIKVYFKYEFMPKGIISNFVVRMHRYIHDQQFVWRYGVLLERENTMAEIIENELDQSINIKIGGHFPQDFMTIIVEEIDKINGKFQEIKVEKYVPCNCRTCTESDDPTFYKYSDLKDRLRVNNPNALKIQCKSLQYDFVDVKSLMESIIILDEKKEKLTKEVDEREDKITPIKVFVSYSKENREALKRIKRVLQPLNREGTIELWDDTNLVPAEDWDDLIKEKLKASDVILCLVSIDFLGTDYIWKTELEEAKANKIKILPIIYDFCSWEEYKVLSKRSALPLKGIPIKSKGNWDTEDKAWLEVDKGIRKLIDNMKKNNSNI